MLYERHVIFRCVLLAYSLWLLRMRSSVRKENIDLPMPSNQTLLNSSLLDQIMLEECLLE